jgi:hypothetical protein
VANSERGRVDLKHASAARCPAVAWRHSAVGDGGDARRPFPRHSSFQWRNGELFRRARRLAEDCEQARGARVRLLERPCRFGQQGFTSRNHLNRVAITAGHKNAFVWLATPERLQNFISHASKLG